MKGWQWYQLDHMQIIFTLPQTDNHASTSPVMQYNKNEDNTSEKTQSYT